MSEKKKVCEPDPGPDSDQLLAGPKMPLQTKKAANTNRYSAKLDQHRHYPCKGTEEDLSAVVESVEKVSPSILCPRNRRSRDDKQDPCHDGK